MENFFTHPIIHGWRRKPRALHCQEIVFLPSASLLSPLAWEVNTGVIYLERQSDSQLEEIKALMMTMAGNVEKAIDEATQSIGNKDVARLQKVFELEQKINEAHIKVDNACVEYMARQSPLAKDLRWVVSIVKINTDLERMGDQCMNIALTTKDFIQRNQPVPHQDILAMAQLSRSMVKSCLDCFISEDLDVAKKVLLADDEIDDYKHKVFRDLCEYIKKNPAHTEAALDIILIARNFERLGDHATNIAEDVVFVSTGKDIRHGGKYA